MRAAVGRAVDAHLRGRLARRVAPAAADVHDVRIALDERERVDLTRSDLRTVRAYRDPSDARLRRGERRKNDDCTDGDHHRFEAHHRTPQGLQWRPASSPGLQNPVRSHLAPYRALR